LRERYKTELKREMDERLLYVEKLNTVLIFDEDTSFSKKHKSNQNDVFATEHEEIYH